MRARRTIVAAVCAVGFIIPSALPAPAGGIEAMIRARFGKHGDAAVRVAHCESRLTARAVGGPNKDGTYDYGVFQLNNGGTMQGLGLRKREALDAATNIDAAYRLWKRRGWQPWSCQP